MVAADGCQRIECAKAELRTLMGDELTFREIGEVLGISHERIRQIYETGAAKFKKKLEKENSK